MRLFRFRSVAVVLSVVLAMVLGLSTRLNAAPQPPTFETLEDLIRQFFARTGNPQKPRLLTQSQVHDLLEELRGMHIQIPGRHQIVRSFPHDKEFFSRFVLSELSHEPAERFPKDPTYLFQRIDAMCTSHKSLRHFMQLAGEGKAFEQQWIEQERLFPPLDNLVTEDLLTEHGLLSPEQAVPRRRNYTIDHLLELLRSSYNPDRVTTNSPSSLNALGR
ncbi:hypothetical protein DTL21_24140 [Bremerella cremea]|uniref:DUF1549 domain-containing protein n=1 Tax=Blastopirellula marina TaxID=124 RepID=A0A2S8FE73_9BACT|nr:MULTISPECIES: hypothetical protein [Pirellulaceae]PQO30447.1 hypothetical protein C5Y83_24095 [Blastopirellula marina]RCS43800.1 hypothetical protein DTL21_24140 [Bremerella cremea]